MNDSEFSSVSCFICDGDKFRGRAQLKGADYKFELKPGPKVI